MKTLDVTLPSDTEIRMVRVFDAPRHLVRRAMSEPALIQRWLGGKRAEVVRVDNDLRVGGSYRYEFRNGDGSSFFFTGTYEEVSDERIVHTELFNGDPPAAIIENVMVERDGRTTMTMTMRLPDRAIRDMIVATGMSDGAGESYDELAALLPTLT